MRAILVCEFVIASDRRERSNLVLKQIASSACGLLAMTVFFSTAVFAADRAEPTAKVSVSSRPIFDPDGVPPPQGDKDPFFEKMRERSADFLKEEQQRRFKFLEKIRQSSLDQAEKEKKIAKFHREEAENRQDFQRGEQKKIERFTIKKNKKSKKQREKLRRQKEQESDRGEARGQSDSIEGRLREAGGGTELPQDQKAA